ncbi:MAG TPA: PHB depolymerase family esterase [Steroidobacteraceae bacterium]|nr:PHB depolymerase family esterase [Steroidobacteraceae bacterium]
MNTSPPPGSFVAGVFGNSHGSRRYKLFVPSRHAGKPLPLLVMLHGCLQDPDDFALGTRMNLIAEEQRIFVLYPEQSETANQTRCWNWFNAANQQRDQGEPSIIAGMTREVIGSHNIDARRVYIAGMSAGGAMAAIMAATYSDLYAAVGIHSGMPYGAAQNFFAAIAAMKDGNALGMRLPSKIIPLIVFHGDQDIMVNSRNSEQLISQWLGGPALSQSQHTSSNASEGNGRAFTRTVYRDGAGRTVAENWLVHDAGHAWSGGGSAGSFADRLGPDASREMVRFFSEVSQGAARTERGGLLKRLKERLRIAGDPKAV